MHRALSLPSTASGTLKATQNMINQSINQSIIRGKEV